MPRHRLAVAYGLAVVLPIAVALVLLPFRADHPQVVALALVVPVVVVAVLGATGPAVASAIVSGAAYGIAHTEPHWQLAIDDPDDVTTVVALVVVALLVGILCAGVVRLQARDAARQAQLTHLVAFARTAVDERDVEVLAREASDHLVAVLGLQRCRWQPGYHGGVGPVLLPDGTVHGRSGSAAPDRAVLPDGLEVPAVDGDAELGRFVLTPGPDAAVSAEERLTAATIVGLFASAATRA